jgi:uncharacterized membrane protein YdjX (TVP38/TMEM64 family)
LPGGTSRAEVAESAGDGVPNAGDSVPSAGDSVPSAGGRVASARDRVQSVEERVASAGDAVSSRASWWRLGVLLVVLGGTVAVGWATGLAAELSPERLRSGLASAGVCGMLGFLVAFSAGNLLQLPGMAFVTAGVYVYGHLAGALLTLLGAVLAVSVTFWVVRAIGGRPLARVKRPFVRRLLARLERHPVQTIFILRTLFQTSPAVNVALALSRVRFRHYLAGSVAGLVLPVAFVAILFATTGL